MVQLTIAKNPNCQIGANKLIVKLIRHKFDKGFKEKCVLVYPNKLRKIVYFSKMLHYDSYHLKKQVGRLCKDNRLRLSEASHKPKLFIILISFKVLSDFRPYCNICEFCKNWTSLERLLCGNKVIECLNRKTFDAVQSIYKTLTVADNDDVAQ
uniref:Uncharacterized protein n=1 Tax=Glossina palpalis gambiensis TaxID=67801 RepID=A0A1B0BYU3_9MUSC